MSVYPRSAESNQDQGVKGFVSLGSQLEDFEEKAGALVITLSMVLERFNGPALSKEEAPTEDRFPDKPGIFERGQRIYDRLNRATDLADRLSKLI